MIKTKRHNNQSLKDYVTTVTLLENISDGIFILNSGGKIEYVNHSATNMLHTKSTHLIGRYFDDFLMSNNRPPNLNIDKRKNFLEKIEGGLFNDIETKLIDNNHEVPVIININLINDHNNHGKYFIITAKDISQWKNLEKELQEQQAVTISRDRLKLIGELSVGLVHEITQPLLALKMRTELLQQKLADNETPKTITEVNFSEMFRLIKRIEDTIGNVRDYAHQTEDEKITDVEVGDVIKEALKLIEYELTENCIRLKIKKDDILPTIATNKLMLEQVFLNLIKNSIDSIKISDFLENEEKKIIITITSKEKKWLEVSIEDNGIEIENDILDKIFDPFFTTKNFSNNSGLGLTISRNVVNSLGGDIKLESNNSDHKRFVVQLPVIQKDEQEQLFNFIEMLNQGE